MAASSFLTVPAELESTAQELLVHHISHGYRVKIEVFDLAFPETPAMVCTRQGISRIIVIAGKKLRQEKVEAWRRYAMGSQTAVEVVVGCPRESIGVLANLVASTGVGLSSAGGGDGVKEIIRPQDLALPGTLPKLQDQPAGVRKLLAPVFEKWDRGGDSWKDAFKDACEVLESECRAYLDTKCKGAPLSYTDRKGKPATLQPQNVGGMTLGGIATVFCGLSLPLHIESLLCKSLDAINPHRVVAVHKSMSSRERKKLRSVVVNNMWIIANALRQLKN